MMARAGLALAWLMVTLLSPACSPGLPAVVGSPSDYADYRATRVAPSLEARLSAASLYLERQPTGAFRAEVAAWFGRIEPMFYEGFADSADGMQKYLDALPRGPHAADAAQRIEAFHDMARAAAGERLSARGAEFERRLAEAAQSREDVLTAYASFVGWLVDFEGWGHPLDDAKPEFATHFVADPEPTCEANRCTKEITRNYQLEVGGQAQSFVCHLEVTISLSRQGGVTEATVSGPDLFSRLTEAHQARPNATDAAEERALAVAFAVELTSGVIERKLEKRRCDRTPPRGSAMLRKCGGWSLELIPRGKPGDEDRVVIRGPVGL